MSDISTDHVDPVSSLRRELSVIWAAHQAVGLDGYMCLHTISGQDPWRSQQENLTFWFSPTDIEAAVEFAARYYNMGKLPNTTVLLNPIVHQKLGENDYKPLGSGVFWATAFTLGIARLTDDQKQRIDGLNIPNDYFQRGGNAQAGLKMLGFSNRKLDSTDGGHTVAGCRELYELSDIQSDPYWLYYPLSALHYLCTHGIFIHPDFSLLLPEPVRNSEPSDIVRAIQVDVQKTRNAAECWNAYDRHHTLYVRFGQNPQNIAHNNRFFSLCARDIFLFDRTGPMRNNAKESFDFLVPGLIPRGAVTLLAAAAGTGKSSLAHQLCVLAAIDYGEEEEPEHWLGQPVNKDTSTGICVYFSGEDGPAITNTRGQIFDPAGRALRLQFHRTEFMDQDLSFPEYLNRLHKMPDVSIVVVDPARKYLSGDEDDADAVSEFFEAIEEFAIRKHAAVVVVHHLQKGAKPQSCEEVIDELRGSQVFIDRPRVILGMYRDNKHTVVGVTKTNIPPSLGMVLEERVFVRNPKNLKLVWLPGAEGVRRKYLSEEEIEQIEMQSFKAQLEPGGFSA